MPRRPDPSAQQRAIRKFQRERLIGRYVANPIVSGLQRLGVRTSLATTLETTGRKSGEPRAVPVAATFDDEGAWIVSQHGRRSGWALNVSADPEVRILEGEIWRAGTAEFRPEDDTHARMRTFAPSATLEGITTSAFRALASDPISVRITFVDAP